MALNKDGILFRGFHEKHNPRILLTEQLMRSDRIRGSLMEVVCEKSIGEELPIFSLAEDGVPEITVRVKEVSPAEVYDMAIKEKVEEFLSGERTWHERFMGRALEMEEVEIDFDPICHLAYAIVNNERCVQAAEKLLENPGECLQYYEKSEYCSESFECNFQANRVWMARIVLGFLEKVREQQEVGEDAALLMKIVYAGYKFMRQALKGRKSYDCELVRTRLSSGPQEKNIMLLMCQTVLFFLVGEDMDVELEYDYLWLLIMMGVEYYVEDFTEFAPEGEAKPEEEQKAFLREFEKKFHTVSSTADLIVREDKSSWEDALYAVMSLEYVSYRLFWKEDLELSREEVEQLVCCSDSWTEETYRAMLVIRQLCKYIRRLTGMYLENSSESCRVLQQQLEQEKEELLKKNREAERTVKQLTEEKEKQEALVVQLRQSLQQAKEQMQEAKAQVQEARRMLKQYKKELAGQTAAAWESSADAARRTSTEAAQGTAADAGRPKAASSVVQEHMRRTLEAKLAEDVLVVGGHDHWQQKLRERYPGWQFVGAGQRNFTMEGVRGKKYIICNTELLKHSCFYRMIAARTPRQRILYVHSNNIERCMQELAEQLDAE